MSNVHQFDQCLVPSLKLQVEASAACESRVRALQPAQIMPRAPDEYSTEY